MWGLDQAIANSARQAEEISMAFEEQQKAERQHRERLEAVSYTHLTLPTT